MRKHQEVSVNVYYKSRNITINYTYKQVEFGMYRISQCFSTMLGSPYKCQKCFTKGLKCKNKELRLFEFEYELIEPYEDTNNKLKLKDGVMII